MGEYSKTITLGDFKCSDETIKFDFKNINNIDVPNCEPKDPLIFIKNESLSKDICDKIIEKFEKDNRRVKGRMGGGKLDISVKNTSDLLLTSFEDWFYFDKILFENLMQNLKEYMFILKDKNINLQGDGNLFDTGFQIQKYDENEGHYMWHNDYSLIKSTHSIFDPSISNRYITFIWYLNDVNEGGETFFMDGKVKPTTGKLLLFPATWTYLHKGDIPRSNSKYIITGWLYNNSISKL